MVDHLIIGQGICGTFLSWYMAGAGRSFLMIDQPKSDTASRVAAGIINPVTGRRIVKTWMIDEVMPFAKKAYDDIGGQLGISIIEQKDIVDFFASPQMRLAFHERIEQEPDYLSLPKSQAKWQDTFNDDFGFGEISPCWLVDIHALLDTYRTHIKSRMIEEVFDPAFLQIGVSPIQYKDITARSVIFCDGVAGAANPYFQMLPFAPNKGEVLWIESADIPDSHIFKNGINVVPWEKNVFWVGSSYQWEFQDQHPTEAFRARTILSLKKWLKVPFVVVDHKASVRPATLERRPFVGFHPIHGNIGIFNGMGVKGCSLAPFFAKQFVDHLTLNKPLLPEVDVLRFKNILMKSTI